jgi:hypothetical protein
MRVTIARGGAPGTQVPGQRLTGPPSSCRRVCIRAISQEDLDNQAEPKRDRINAQLQEKFVWDDWQCFLPRSRTRRS